MFGGSRRHRPPNPHLNSSNVNPNATTAAASAFMSASNQNPNRTLSSAAAAAALKARPSTPTNVSEVQTKRTMRRNASVSSAGSSAAGVAASGRAVPRLERRGSSGSMTERTFRSPSPHRNTPSQPVEDQPPVPRIPANHRKSTSSGAAGVGMQNFKTASQKMKTQTPSYYTQPSGDPSNVRKSDATMRTTKSPPPISESMASMQRSDSRNSFNFSYPTSFRPQSPPASPTSTAAPQWTQQPARAPVSPPRPRKESTSSSTGGRTAQALVYDPNSRRMVPRAIPEDTEYRIRESSEKPMKKKKTDSTVQRTGSYLAKGTVGRLRGTTVDSDSRERGPGRREQPVVEASPSREESQLVQEPTMKTGNTPPEMQKQPEGCPRARSPDTQEPLASLSSSREAPSEPANQYSSAQAIGSKVSLVEEEEEEDPEYSEPNPQPSQKVLDALDAVPTRQSLFNAGEPTRITADSHDISGQGQYFTTSYAPEASTGADQIHQSKKASFAENKPVVELVRENGGVRRSNSNSPARQARFATSPPENLAIRHVPLPRSASPIKPALKRISPAPRGLSPSDSDISRSRGASPSTGEDQPVSRKKSVRVSFDDRSNTIVGESLPTDDADTPIPSSPQQAKRPWYSALGRNKKKDYALEDDEVMQPRPALPSFGSVRKTKNREPEERPLVRPLEPAYSPGMPSSPELRPQSSSTLGGTDTQEPQLDQTNDHPIGSLVPQDSNSRVEANISRFREPLPPIVTSIEGNGYLSDSVQSSSSEALGNDNALEASDVEVMPSTQVMQPEIQHATQIASTIPEEKSFPNADEIPRALPVSSAEIPEITIIQPTPMASETHLQPKTSARPQYFDVPGGFPDDTSDDGHNARNADQNAGAEPLEGSTNADSIFEPVPAVQPAQIESLPQTTLSSTTPVTTVEEDNASDASDASIYSDAYEDLSDFEGEGFQSLDAVVESPISKIAETQLPELPGDVPSITKTSVEQELPVPEASRSPEPPRDLDDWEQAKTFWRSLTAEKRLQLEREAKDDAGTEGDREEIAQPVRRNSSRKKTSDQNQMASQPRSQVAIPSTKSLREPKPDRVSTSRDSSQDVYIAKAPSHKSSRMRISMRDGQPTSATKNQAPSGMRRTMRSGVEAPRVEPSSNGRGKATSNRTITQTPASAQAPRTKSRPQSMPIDKPGSIASKPAQPSLQRRGSDASDSSFRRSRAASSGGFTFRKTMRQSTGPQSSASAQGSGRFSIRSLSPSGSAIGRSSAASPSGAPPVSMMRRTLRSNSESSQEGKRSSMHFPSFGRSGKRPASKQSNRPSRFGGSSDEDDGGRAGFRSRFGDSSDEEGDTAGASRQGGPLLSGTLRGSATAPAKSKQSIPEEAEDSSQLPDSDNADAPSPLQSPRSRIGTTRAPGMERTNSGALGTTTLSRSRSGRGGFNTSMSTPDMPTKQRRGSFMGILRRNKKVDQAGKIQRSEGLDSAARRDTKLERNAGQLKTVRQDLPSSPKLQKRSPLKHNDSWPLPEAVNGDERPSSAGNILSGRSSTALATPRPGLADRRSMSLGQSQTAATTVGGLGNTPTIDTLGQPKKKKKFGTLRRMFKLDE
ncbi:hypothetical protein F4778DRAFT_763829 [Xylariomycetidae sp. FL2044]|nr:hypothetical protein F4778DRAFT_763829 [Xylariomycetidae sp. FL2044]